MSIALPHSGIEFSGDDADVAELAKKVDENFQEVSSQAIAVADGVDTDAILVLSSTSPKARTLNPFTTDDTQFLDSTGEWSDVDDADLVMSDVTTNNVSTTKHGFTPKLPNDATKYLDGTGSYSVPVGSGTTGRLIGVQRITTTGAYTYTATTGTQSVIIELQGAGGGGGGVANPGAGNVALASAGCGGGWLRVRLTSNFNGGTGSVGAKGGGGSAGNNAGSNGGSTTFVDASGTPVTYTAGGGNGGAGSASLGAPPSLRQPNIAAGTVTNGDDKQDGWPGTMAYGNSTSNALGGYGGNSRYGRGGVHNSIGANGTQAGGAASGKGAGGGAACALGTGVAAAGGDGSDGMVIIWEYA